MYETATFGAGCFWHVEAVFGHMRGVVSTTVGYTGGFVENPTYRDVCRGDTGHAEAVRIEFDPSAVSYDELLNLFWRIHDPTSLNQQGPDYGTQYRSVIFYHNEDQLKSAVESRNRLKESERFMKDIVTEIVPASQFYRAEEYHQQYMMKQGRPLFEFF